MKKPFLLLLFLITLNAICHAQKFEGTWRGVMVQDSPVVRINFEMALENKEGKIQGYLYRLFIVEDSLIYNTVKVNARVVDKMLVVEDEESVSRNFEEKANRKIKAAYFFKLEKNLSDTLKGEWTTSRYKNKYLAISGTVTVVREPDYETTQLFKRLQEKKLETTVAFVPKKTAPDIVAVYPGEEGGNKPAAETKPQPSTVAPKQEPVISNVVQNKPPQPKADTTQSSAVVSKPIQPEQKINTQQPSTVVSKPKTDSSSVAVNKPVVTPPKNNTPPSTVPSKPITQNNPVVTNNQPKPNASSSTPVPNKPAPAVTSLVVKNEPKPQPSSVTPPVVNTPGPEIAVTKTNEAVIKDSSFAKQIPAAVQPPPVINNPVITKRETEVIQTLNVFEDSVTLSLYDNGEIDGDTVSVFLNNEKIIQNVGLKAGAYKKTIYFKPGETVQLTLFAENLGAIPPNTGLLVVYSGDKRYQVFFTSTLNKSAVVLLKREMP
ncbi:MAG: hypothetical protein K2X48_13355 [Chitinophagaceae bacterium]|nr:hypothetical protein [Chitinophagaceae bacterium]